ncbi:MAG: ABC transporter ATP-binding protein [Gammaproteobacteria bacterium]|jgi:ATP-binding cassette subfamily C protein
MHLMSTFFRAYPFQTFVMLVALLFAGVAEGIGLSALLPLINVAIKADRQDGPAQDQNEFERVVTDILSGLGVQPTIGVLLSIIVLGVTVKSLLLLVANKRVGYTAAQVATDLRLEMLRVILRTKWEYFIHQPVGRLTNSLATEAQRSSEAFVNGVTVITFSIQALIYGLVAVAVSWKATLIGLGAGTVIIGISHFLVRMAKKAGKKQTGLLISLLSRLTDTLLSVKPLKAMGREHLVDGVLAMETNRLNKALRRQVFSSALLNAAQEEMSTIVIAVGMFVALVQFDMPLATVMILVVALGRMLAHFGKVQKQYQKLMIGESAFWSMRRTIDAARRAEELLPSKGTVPAFAHSIRLEDVSFAYEATPVLDRLSLEIPSGSLTALIGPSGSGKTTIIDLVIGLLQPQSGRVLVDDTPLSAVDLKAWRHMIGYVPQETILLHDSVHHNVTLGDTAVSMEDVEYALRGAGAWEFTAALPEGVHSTVGERGGRLSGGQRQRIMIARALAHRPRLLILDEATSALDPASEAEIRKTLEQLRGELTILAISHQTGLVESADRVYRLERGRVQAVARETPLSRLGE